MEKIEFAQKPKESEPWEVAIIGSGPASFTAAIYTTRGAASTIILGGENWGGQLMLTTTVDNYPGFPEGIQGPELMQKMKDQAERFGAEFVAKNVESVDFNIDPHELIAGGVTYKAKTVIIATGADTKWLGVPGEDKLRGRGVSSCAPCDAPFFKGKNVAVVGGGDSAMEEALVLTKYAPSVTLIHRRDELKASAAMQKKVMENDKIRILWSSEVVEMLGEDKLEAVKVMTKDDSKQGEELKKGKLSDFKGELFEEKDGFLYWRMPIDGVFVAIGHTPATSLFAERVETDEKGYVVVHNHAKTNIEKGVFVAGDVHDYTYRQAVTAAGYGCMAGMEALKYLDKSGPSW
jgi:thioredoxin reductase (NADPH)